MLACARGGERLVAVEFVGGRDVDGVDVVRPDQGGEIVGRAPNGMLCGESFRPVRVRAHHRDHFAAAGAHRADHVLRRDRAGANEAPSESGAHEAFLCSRPAPQLSRTTRRASPAKENPAGSSRRIRPSRLRAQRRPISRGSVLIVVSGGALYSASAMSSKPTTAKSRPGAIPRTLSSRVAPIATM